MKFIILVSSILFAYQTFAGKILTATVAKVKNHVVTSREVQMQYLLDQAIKKEAVVYHDKDPVEQLIREWLLYFEASSFYSSQLPGDGQQRVVKNAALKLKTLKGWKKLQVTSLELNTMLRRKAEARRLFLFKKEASILPISETEVEAEYKQNRIRYGTLSFSEVKDKIKKRKTEENLKQRLENWFEVLERKYRVQRFAKYNSEQ